MLDVDLFRGAPKMSLDGPSPLVEKLSQNRRFVPLRALPLWYRIARRVLDIVVATFILTLLFPLFLVIALAIRLTSKGPILYRSWRVGLGGKPFLFLKFRTMVNEAERLKLHLSDLNHHDGPIFKSKVDPRITGVGRILRKLSLDEFPQFIHVLLGQMTLVGPRPHLPSEVVQYDELSLQRLSVKPGLTCYWQIRGRSNIGFEEWVKLDLQYIEEMNIITDFKLLLKTPIAVLRGEGAY